MIKKALLLTNLVGALFAFEAADLVQLYQQKEYKKACDLGFRNFPKIRRDETLLSAYAFSCLYSDQLNRLYLPTMILRKSKESRHNRTYFSLILAQKNILISALFDNEIFEDLHIPYTDYVLSRVFNLFFQKKYQLEDGIYKMEDEVGKYRLYVEKIEQKKWLVIEEIRQGKKIVHKYR